MKKKPVTQIMLTEKQLLKASAEFDKMQALKLAEVAATAKPISYRKLALEHYRKEVYNLCVVCGFGIAPVLEVAHLDQNRKNNAVENLAVLCPNCHKMHDIGLLPTQVIQLLRDEHRDPNWGPRIKDAGQKAAATRKVKALKSARSASAKKAWVTRDAKK